MPDGGGDRDLQNKLPGQDAETQPPLISPTGFDLPGDVLPLPRAAPVQVTSTPFQDADLIASIIPPHTATAAQAETPSPAGPCFPTDELCSRDLISILMADYLNLIYPLIPVVHRPNFRSDLARNRDTTDSDFAALLVSLCALTVGLLPSRYEDYRAVDPEAGKHVHFETRTAFIDCCADICYRQRTASYWDHVNHRKWAVSYVFSIACFQTGQVNRSRMFDVEYMQLSRLLGLHRISEYEGLNCIETQLRKKAFWLLFYGYA
jgi:hypothetical protein